MFFNDMPRDLTGRKSIQNCENGDLQRGRQKAVSLLRSENTSGHSQKQGTQIGTNWKKMGEIGTNWDDTFLATPSRPGAPTKELSGISLCRHWLSKCFLLCPFSSIMCKWARPVWGQTAGGHPKASPGPGSSSLHKFAVPALRELESACRVSIL